MTIYVDDVRHAYGRMKMCHLWADTDAELHEMARKIGVARRWFQGPPKSRWNHYDICISKKKQAIALGAVLTDKFGPLEFLACKAGNFDMLLTIQHCRNRRRNRR